MRLDRRLLLSAAIIGSVGVLLPARATQPHLTVTTGTVTGFDQQSRLLNVNTRLGPRFLLVTADTLVFLNNRLGDLQDLDPGDFVEVEYRFDTSEVFFIRITRETRLKGRVVSVGANNLVFRLDRGGQLTLNLDDQTVLKVADIPVDGTASLVGRRGYAIIESGGQLLLRFAGDASVFGGRLTSVDVVNSRVVVTGKKTRTFALSDTASVSLNSGFTTLEALEPGDRVRVAFVRRNGISGVAVEAFR